MEIVSKVHPIAITLGIAGALASVGAVALDKSLPYRIGFSEYSRYLWAGRLTGAAVGLALPILLCGMAARKGWLPFALALISLSPLLIVGRAHSGPNPEAWCYNNLRQIGGAKERLAHERGLTNSSPVTMTDVSRFITAGRELRCAEHGTYIIGPIGGEPRCSVLGTIPEMEAAWRRAAPALQDGVANRSQPVRSQTSQSSAAAGSGR
jgi:hypothetical protein